MIPNYIVVPNKKLTSEKIIESKYWWLNSLLFIYNQDSNPRMAWSVGARYQTSRE
jgi:hypothetical protein